MKLEDVNLYRITHIDNIPHVLQYGVTHRNSPNANPNFIAIGDVSLINSRDQIKVRVDNGNFLNLEAPQITLGDYIPFYFGVRMPMLYVIQNGGNFVMHPTPPDNIVYLACPILKIISNQRIYYFSDGHGTDNYTTFYNHAKIYDLPDIIDWNAVKADYWSGQENLNVKRKKQAEFLASADISPSFITKYGCYNDAAKQKLISYGISEEQIKIIPQAYY
jgi:hypothetical protein